MRGGVASSYWSADGITWTAYATATASAVWGRPAIHFNRAVVAGGTLSNYAVTPQDLEPEFADTTAIGAPLLTEVITPMIEGLATTDSLVAAAIALAMSGLRGADVLAVQADLLATVAEALRLSGMVRVLLDAPVIDAVTFGELAAGTPRVTSP